MSIREREILEIGMVIGMVIVVGSQMLWGWLV